jgi:hypothetical protein
MGTQKYLETEIALIKESHKASGSKLTLDEYAMLWIEKNAVKFAEEHQRDLND